MRNKQYGSQNVLVMNFGMIDFFFWSVVMPLAAQGFDLLYSQNFCIAEDAIVK